MTTATVVDSRDPVEIVRDVFERVLNQRDPEALLPYWAEDIVEEFPVGIYRGRDAVKRYFAETFAALPDFEIRALSIAGQGDTVFVRWRVTGTFDGATWMGIEPTGARIELNGIDCFTIRGGKVVANFVVFDQLSFATQIGMLPKRGTALDRAMTKAFNLKTRLAGRKR
ncbi:MAG: nuclear transport factor 2 family protein [Myxococcales bacterium]|nr:nuclear transport factor 2 family protein [Myxococcales bacterium]